MNNIVPLRAGAVPAFFASQSNLPDMGSAAQQGLTASFAVLSTKGKNWRIKYRSEEELLKSNGQPMTALDVVVVGISPYVSKNFYGKGFQQDSKDAPDCYSANGITPDPASARVQAPSCAVCPNNAWGSKITEGGKKSKACQDNRRIAVVPAGDLENLAYGGPMLLRLPPMSLNNLSRFTLEMKKFGAQPYMVKARIGFSDDVTYQEVQFEPLGWLDEEEARTVFDIIEDPLIKRMLETEEPAPAETSPLAGGRPAAAFAQPRQAPAPAPTPPPAPVQQAPPPPPPPPPASPFAAAMAQAQPAQAAQAAQVAQAAQTIDAVKADELEAAPEPVATTVVRAAPANLETAIDDLLAS